jgi:(S)-ureidoglycine aminohydrolase
MDVFGPGRSHVGRNYAFITPDSFVRSPLPGWERTEGIILIAPRMGARFTQFLAHMEPGGTAGPSAAGVERVVYVLDGSLTVRPGGGTEQTLTAGGFAFVPAGADLRFRAATACRLNVFEKRYVPRPGITVPQAVVGREQDVEGQPFLGDPDARLHVLLPDEPAFDLAVNVFRFKPGATLPFVEVHVMEHGLLMLEGQGVYRLGDSWYPVRASDVIWMAPYCPQWFVAMGKTPSAYLYYKDVNRDPLGGAS